MDRGLVNADRVILERELRDYLLESSDPNFILSQVSALHGKAQILEWTSNSGHSYRFFIQEIDSEGEPLLEVAHPLVKKEFTYGGN